MSDKWKENAMKYLSERWNEKSFLNMYQKSALKETLEIFKQSVLKNGVDIVFDGKKLHFDCLTERDVYVKIKLLDMGVPTNRGEINYNKNTIHLNKNMTMGADFYTSLAHEFTHKIQSALIRYMDEYNKDSVEYKYLSLLKSQIEQRNKSLDSFGIKIFGNLYFTPHIYVKSQMIDLNMPLYHLQISERNAKEVECNALKYLEKCSGHKFNMQTEKDLEESVKAINNFYRSSWTNSQLFQIIDNASFCIDNGIAPKKYADFTATLMYDMMSQLYAKHYEWEKNEQYADEYSRILERESKSIALRDSYDNMFAVYNSRTRVGDTVVLNEIENKQDLIVWQYDADYISNLTENQKISNPRYMTFALLANSTENIASIVGEVQKYKESVFSDFGYFDEEVLVRLEKRLNIDIAKEYQEFEKSVILNRENPENINLDHSILKERFNFEPYHEEEIEQDDMIVER